jgi:hypothetical protein
MLQTASHYDCSVNYFSLGKLIGNRLLHQKLVLQLDLTEDGFRKPSADSLSENSLAF